MADTGSLDAFAYAPPRATARSASWPTVAVFAGLMAGLAVSSAFAFNGVYPLWAGCLINAALLYVLAHINHEAIHRNISAGAPRLRWLNETIGYLGSFWFFLPFPAFKAVHLAHHAAPNHPATDGDMWVAREHPLAIFGACATILVGYEFQIWRMIREGRMTRATAVSIYGQRLAFLVIVGALTAMGYGWETFLLWVGPALIVMPMLAFFFAYIVHRPHHETDPYRASNVLLASGPLQPLVTALFVFQNYHLVHHLNPRIPFYQYGTTFRRMRAELETKNAAISTIA